MEIEVFVFVRLLLSVFAKKLFGVIMIEVST